MRNVPTEFRRASTPWCSSVGAGSAARGPGAQPQAPFSAVHVCVCVCAHVYLCMCVVGYVGGCGCGCANCHLPHHMGIFSCKQFSHVAVLCLLVQASLNVG